MKELVETTPGSAELHNVTADISDTTNITHQGDHQPHSTAPQASAHVHTHDTEDHDQTHSAKELVETTPGGAELYNVTAGTSATDETTTHCDRSSAPAPAPETMDHASATAAQQAAHHCHPPSGSSVTGTSPDVYNPHQLTQPTTHPQRQIIPDESNEGARLMSADSPASQSPPALPVTDTQPESTGEQIPQDSQGTTQRPPILKGGRPECGAREKNMSDPRDDMDPYDIPPAANGQRQQALYDEHGTFQHIRKLDTTDQPTLINNIASDGAPPGEKERSPPPRATAADSPISESPDPRTTGEDTFVGKSLYTAGGGKPSEPWLPTPSQANDRYAQQVDDAYLEAQTLKLEGDKVVISVNVNGFKSKLAAWRKGEGGFLKMITRLKPDIILVSEAHYSQKDDFKKDQFDIAILLNIELGGIWKVHISPCRLKVGYAGTMVMIKTTSEGAAEGWVCSSYIGPTGAPFPGTPEVLDKYQRKTEEWTQNHGQREGRYTILWDKTETVNPHVMVAVYGVYPKQDDVRGGPANAIIQELRKLVNYLTRTLEDPVITICGDTNTFNGPDSYKLEGIEEVSGMTTGDLITQHLKIWTGSVGLAAANDAAQDRHRSLTSGRGGVDTTLHDAAAGSRHPASVQMMTKFAALREDLKKKQKKIRQPAIIKLAKEDLFGKKWDPDTTITARKLDGGELITISAMKFHTEPRTFTMTLDHVLTTNPDYISMVKNAEYSSLVTNADRMCHTDHAATIFVAKNRSNITKPQTVTTEKKRSQGDTPPRSNATRATMGQDQALGGFLMAAGYALEDEATRCAMYIPQSDSITKAEEATGRVHAYTATQTAKMLRLVSKQAWEDSTMQQLRQTPPATKSKRPLYTTFARLEQNGTTPHESEEAATTGSTRRLTTTKESHLHPSEVRAAPVTAIARRAQVLHNFAVDTMPRNPPHQHTPIPTGKVAFFNLVSQIAGETGMPTANAVRATRIHLGIKKAQNEPPADTTAAASEFRKAWGQLMYAADIIQLTEESQTDRVRMAPQRGGERGERPTPTGIQSDPAGLTQEPGSRRAPVEAVRLAGWSRIQAIERCSQILHRRAREIRRTYASTADVDGNLVGDITRLDAAVERLSAAQREFVSTGAVSRAGDPGRRTPDLRHCTQRLSDTVALLVLKIRSGTPTWKKARNKARKLIAAKDFRTAWGHLTRGKMITNWRQEVLQRQEHTKRIADSDNLTAFLKPTIGSDNAQRLNKLMTLFKIKQTTDSEEREWQYSKVWGRMIATGREIVAYLGNVQHDRDDLWQHLTEKHRAKPNQAEAGQMPTSSPRVIAQRWRRVVRTYGEEILQNLFHCKTTTHSQRIATDSAATADQPEAPYWRFHLKYKRSPSTPTITPLTGGANTLHLNPRMVSSHLESIRKTLREELGAPSAWAWHQQPEDETAVEPDAIETAYLEVYHDLQLAEVRWITRIASTITPEISARVGRHYQQQRVPLKHRQDAATEDSDESSQAQDQQEELQRIHDVKSDPDGHRREANAYTHALMQILQSIGNLATRPSGTQDEIQQRQEKMLTTVPPRPPRTKQSVKEYVKRMGVTTHHDPACKNTAVTGGQPAEANLLEEVGAPYYTSAYIGRQTDLKHRIQCTVLIDSGCATEFISAEMAGKLREQAIINDNDYTEATQLRAQSAFGQDEHTKGALQLGLTLNHIDLAENGDIKEQGTKNHKMSARILDKLQVDLIIGARGIRHYGIHIPGELDEEDQTGWVGSTLQIGPRNDPTTIRCHTHARWQVGDHAPIVARENISWTTQGIRQQQPRKLGIQIGTHMVADLKRRIAKATAAKQPEKYYLRLEPLSSDPKQAQVHVPTLVGITFEKNCTCTGTCGCAEEVVATVPVTSGASRNMADLPPGTLLGTAILESKRFSETTPVHGGVSNNDSIQTHANSIGQLMAVNILSTKGEVSLDSNNPLHWRSQRILHDQRKPDRRALTKLWDKDKQRALASLQAAEAHRTVKDYLQQHVIISNKGVIINPTNAGRALAVLASLLEIAYKTAPYIIGPATQHPEWLKLAKAVRCFTQQTMESEPDTAWAMELIKDSIYRIFHIKRAMASTLTTTQQNEGDAGSNATLYATDHTIGLATIEASTMIWHQHLVGTTGDIKDRSCMAPNSTKCEDITNCTERAWRLLSQGHTIDATPTENGGMRFKVNQTSGRQPGKREDRMVTSIISAIQLHGHRIRTLLPQAQPTPPAPPCATHAPGGCSCCDNPTPFGVKPAAQQELTVGECNKMSVEERTPEAMTQHLQQQQTKITDREAAQAKDINGDRFGDMGEASTEDPSTSPPAAMSRVDGYAGARAKIPPYMPPKEAAKNIWWWPRADMENERALLAELATMEADKEGGGHRRIAYLQSVQFDDDLKQMANEEDENETQASRRNPDSPHNIRRAIAHLHVWNCIRNFKTIDVDPYNGPTIDTATLGTEFLTLTTKEAVFDPPRQLPPDAVEQANEMVDYMVRSGQAIEATSSFNHNVLLVPKKQDRNTTQKSWRLCNDLRRLNEKTLRTHWRLLPTMNSLETVASYDRFSVSDAVSGYYQCRIDPSISHKFSFSVGNRRLVPTKSLMGGLNSGALYCLAMARAIGHMNTGICKLDQRNKLIKREPKLLEAAKKRYEEGVRVIPTPDAASLQIAQSAAYGSPGSVTPPTPAETEKGLVPAEVSAGVPEGVIPGAEAATPWEPSTEDERNMQEWVERSLNRPRPTIGRAQSGDNTWDECDGIPLDDTRHRCKAVSYVDDVIIAGKDNRTGSLQQNAITFSRCNEHVLRQLGAHGAMLKAQKTTFDTRRLEFLGWEIGPEGLQPSTKKINAFTKMCRPRNKDELQRFIGCTQYFRNSIPAISLHEQPLYDLTKKGVAWRWTDVEDAAFNEIKRILSSDAVLARRNPDCTSLILAVDSSTIGTGAVLSQVVDGKEEAIAYVSTTFKNGSSWSGTEKEVTGILWAIQEVRQLIHDKKLTVITDHRPVKSIVTKRNLNAKLHRMVLAIQDIDCDFEHREGRKMVVPDALSRLLDYADLYDSVEGEVLKTQHHLNTFEADETERIIAEKQKCEGAGVEHLKQQRWGADQLRGEGTLDLEKRTLVRGLTLGSLQQCRKHIDKWREKYDQIAKAITDGATKIVSDGGEETDITKQATGLRGQAEEGLLSTLGGLKNLINLAADDEKCSLQLEEQYGEDYLERIYPHRNKDGSMDMHIWETTPEGTSSTREILRAEGIQLEDQSSSTVIVAGVDAFIQGLEEADREVAEMECEAHDDLAQTIESFTINGLGAKKGQQTQNVETTENKRRTNFTVSMSTEEETDGTEQPNTDSDSEEAAAPPATINALSAGISELLWEWSSNNTAACNNIRAQEAEPQEQQQITIPPVAADLFTGAGGGIGAFIEEGFTAGACCEQGHIQQLSLRDRYKIEAIKDWSDMRPHHFRGAFVVISCSPCTTFSTAGHKDGLEHKRGQYYPKQVQEAIKARVPLIIIENVERVTEAMPYNNPSTGKPGRESPMNLLKSQLSQQGYIVHHELLDAGLMAGKTRKRRAILQAMLPELQQHREEVQGTTEEAKQSYLQVQEMGTTHRIDEQGFIWPLHTGEQTSIHDIMIPWEQRPESHKLRVAEWPHFELSHPVNRDGAIRLGNRRNDGSIGDRDNPNRVYSYEGRAPGITAMGNTGWYLVPDAAPADVVQRLQAEGKTAYGMIRLTGEEVKRMAGFTGMHDIIQHSSTILSEDEVHKMVNNALDMHLSSRLAQGAKCMYDEEWMRQHVRNTERDLGEDLKYQQATFEATKKLGSIAANPPSSKHILEEDERSVTIKPGGENDTYKVIKAVRAITQDLNPRKTFRDEQALHNTTIRAQHTVEAYLGSETRLIAGGAPSNRASAATREEEQQKPETEEHRSRTRRDRKYRINIITKDKETVKENVILRDATNTMSDVGKHIPRNGIRQAQREDRELRLLIDYAEQGKLPNDPIDRNVLNTKEEYTIHNDILYHIGRVTGKAHTAEDDINGDYYMQLVVPQALRSKLIKDYHANLGHASAKTVAESLKSRYWWTAMSRDIDLVVSECDICQRYKATRPTCGGIRMQLTEEAGRPWETIWMDFIGPYGKSSTKKSNTCALVIVDDFSRWVEATPCISSDSKTVAETLKGWFLRHGFPRHIKSDRGSSLISKPMQLLYNSMGIAKSESASLHPQSHGKVERANKYIQSCLRTHTARGDMEWDEALENATAAWNWSQKDLSGLSPYQIVHGYRPRMEFNELDATAPDTGTKFSNTTKWAQALMEQHADLCHKLTDEHLNFKLKYIQAHNDQIKSNTANTFAVGDKVRVFMPATSSRTGLASKLQARYTTIYTVEKQVTDYTYRVKKDNDSRPSVAVHANRLVKCNTPARTSETTAQCEIENLSDEIERIDNTLSDLMLGLTSDSPTRGEHRANAERALAKHRHTGDSKPIGLDQAKAILDEVGDEFGDLEQKIRAGEWEFICSNIENTLRSDIPRQKRDAPTPDKELGDLEGHMLEAPPEPSNVEDQADIENASQTQQPKPTKSRRHRGRVNPVKCITWEEATTTVRKVAQRIKADCDNLVRDLAKHWVGAPPTHATYVKMGMKVPITSQRKDALKLGKDYKITMEHPNAVGNQIKGWLVTEITDQKISTPEDPADGTTPTLHYYVTWDANDLAEGENSQEWVPVERLTGCSEAIQKFKDKQCVAAVHVRGGKPHEILTTSKGTAKWSTVKDAEQTDQHSQMQRETHRLMEQLPTTVAKEGHDMVIWDTQEGMSQETEQAIQQRCGTESILQHVGMEPVLAAPIILSRREAVEPADDLQAEDEDGNWRDAEKGVRSNRDVAKEALRIRSNPTGEYARIKAGSPDNHLALMGISNDGIIGPTKIIDLREFTREITATQWRHLQRRIRDSDIWGVIINPDHLTLERMGMWKDMIREGSISHIMCSRTYTEQGSNHRRKIMKWLEHQDNAGRHNKVTDMTTRNPELASILHQGSQEEESSTSFATSRNITDRHTQRTVTRLLDTLQEQLFRKQGITVSKTEARAWDWVKDQITRHHMLRTIEGPDNMTADISLLEAVSTIKIYLSCHVCYPPLEPPPPSTMEAALATVETVVRSGLNNTQQMGRTDASPDAASLQIAQSVVYGSPGSVTPPTPAETEKGLVPAEVSAGVSEGVIPGHTDTRETNIATKPDTISPEASKTWTLQTIGAATGGLTFGELLERTTTQRYLKRWILDLLHDQQLETVPQGHHIGLNSRLTIKAAKGNQQPIQRNEGGEEIDEEIDVISEVDVTSEKRAPAETEPGESSYHKPEGVSKSMSSRPNNREEDLTTPASPQIKLILCDNPHPQSTIRVITSFTRGVPEGSTAAQQELSTAISHKVRRAIASREIKAQIGLSVKSQGEHLYSKQAENCLQANRRHLAEGSIIQEGNTYHIVYIASHLGIMHKTIKSQTHKWTNLSQASNMSEEVKLKISQLLHRPQQIRTSKSGTMGTHLYMARCAGDGTREQTTLYTTKAFPQGKELGNLHIGTATAPEGYTPPKGHKVIHRFTGRGQMELLKRTPNSDAIWELAGRDRNHNCDITADGSVITNRVIRKGETLTLSYGYLPEASNSPLVQGGQVEQQQHWQALDDWITATATDQEQAELDPDSGRELWERTAALGEESPSDVHIGSFVARTGRIDLPVILQALHNDEDDSQQNLQARRQSLTDAIKNRDIPALTIAAWSQFRRTAKEDTQRIVASAKSKMMKTNLTEVIDLLKRAEVTNSETAREWERVFLQGACKQLMDAIKQNEELRYNFQMCLTYAEEAQEAASKKQIIEEQALRNVPLIWLDIGGTTTCTLKVHPHHLRSSRIAFSKGAEITIRSRGKDATVAKGIIDDIESADSSGLQSINVTVRRATGNTEGRTIADVTPVYRSAQGMYQRTALHRIWKCPDDELTEEFQDVRNFLMGRVTKTLDATALQRQGKAWETLRRDRGHPEHTEDQTEIMNKVGDNTFTLAQGPPGTGKSKTAVDVVARALHVQRNLGHKGKILIVVPTNVTAQDYVMALRGAALPGDDAPIRLVWVLGVHWEKRAEEEAARVSLSKYTTHAPTWIQDYLKKTRTMAEQNKLERMHNKRENGGMTDGEEAEYYRLRNQAQKRILSQAEVLVMTTQQAGKKAIRDLAKSERLTLRVVDESGMIGENDLSVVLALRCWRTLIIGDHEQLPARYDSKLAKKAKLQSSFADLVADNQRCTMLRHVFRNTLESIAWVNNNIYKGKLKQFDWCKDGLTKRSEALKIFATPECGKAWVELDTSQAPESKPEGSTSKVNIREAEVTLQLVKKILQMGNIKAEQISVITLYAAQEREIRQRLMECEQSAEVKVGTIDAYQGKENELIIFLTTRSSPQASEFIKNTHRMNVMLTRHKAGVIGIGTGAMKSCSPEWTTLIQDYQRGGGLSPELQNHLGTCLIKEVSAEAAPAHIACISLPCELCIDSKATRLFTTRDLRLCKPRWSPTAGGIYIETRTMIKKGTGMQPVSVQELNHQELPATDTKKRSMAWYIREADTEDEINIRWKYDDSNATVYAYTTKDIPEGIEMRSKERAIKFAETFAKTRRIEKPQQASKKIIQQNEAAPLGLPEAAQPLTLQERMDQMDAKRRQQFAAFERKITAREHWKRSLKRRLRDPADHMEYNPLAHLHTSTDENERGGEESQESPLCPLSYLHTGTPEGGCKNERTIREKWRSIAKMRGARQAWEVADYPYLKHKEYPNRQEFFQESYVLGKNDSLSKIQRWWDQNDGDEVRTSRTQIRLAAHVRATALALQDLLYRLHSHYLQDSRQVRSSLDSARLDLEGVAYLLTDTAVSQIQEREIERQSRVEIALKHHQREAQRDPRPPSQYDPEEVITPSRETTSHAPSQEAPEEKNSESSDKSSPSRKPKQQPMTMTTLELILRAMVESTYTKEDVEQAEELNKIAKKLADSIKGVDDMYERIIQEWAEGDSGMNPADNIGKRRNQTYEDEIEANVQRICTTGQTIRHCARYMTAQDAEQAEKETNKGRARDLNGEMTRYHSDMILAQVKKLAHERARTKIGELTSRNATSWNRDNNSEDHKAEEPNELIEAWKIAESDRPADQHFNIKTAKGMIARLQSASTFTKYIAEDGQVVKGLLGFLLNVDNGKMKNRTPQRRPTRVPSDELHLRKQDLGKVHLPDNQRGMRLIHHSSQLDIIWKHRHPGDTKWLDDKDETTGRLMERKPANDETFGLFLVDVQQRLPPVIKSNELEMRTEHSSQDVWRMSLETQAPFIDQFIIIRIVTREDKPVILTYREQWDNRGYLAQEEEKNKDGFYYALLNQQHGETCDHAIAEWWTCIWVDTEEIHMGKSNDDRVTNRVRDAAGEINCIPDPDEHKSYMKMPPGTDYILRYLRASQAGIQECHHTTRTTEEDKGLPAHQAMRQWLRETHRKGGNLDYIPKCNVEAWPREEDEWSTAREQQSHMTTTSPEIGINRRLPGAADQYDDQQMRQASQQECTQHKVYNIDITDERTISEGRDEITTKQEPETETGDTLQETIDPQTHQQGGGEGEIALTAVTMSTEDTSVCSPAAPTNRDNDEQAGSARIPTLQEPETPTWAEVTKTRAHINPTVTPPASTSSKYSDPDEGWTTVTAKQAQHKEAEDTTSDNALDDTNFRAVYLHIHRRRVVKQHVERAIRFIRDTGVQRFCLPYLNEGKEQYLDRIDKMRAESDEGTKAIQEYLQHERNKDTDESRSATLRTAELKSRLQAHCTYSANKAHEEWAEKIKRELAELRDLSPATFHSCRSLPRSNHLTTAAAKAQASDLLHEWAYHGL